MSSKGSVQDPVIAFISSSKIIPSHMVKKNNKEYKLKQQVSWGKTLFLVLKFSSE